MSLSIDELGSLYGLYGVNSGSNTNNQASKTISEKDATDGDTYISTIAKLDPTAALPSENYNELGKLLKASSKASGAANSTDYASVFSGVIASGTGTAASVGAQALESLH